LASVPDTWSPGAAGDAAGVMEALGTTEAADAALALGEPGAPEEFDMLSAVAEEQDAISPDPAAIAVAAATVRSLRRCTVPIVRGAAARAGGIAISQVLMPTVRAPGSRFPPFAIAPEFAEGRHYPWPIK
jgi:hypothetical protein